MKTVRNLLLSFLACLPLCSLAGPVDINTADAETLSAELDGVGRAHGVWGRDRVARPRADGAGCGSGYRGVHLGRADGLRGCDPAGFRRLALDAEEKTRVEEITGA